MKTDRKLIRMQMVLPTVNPKLLVKVIVAVVEAFDINMPPIPFNTSVPDAELRLRMEKLFALPDPTVIAPICWLVLLTVKSVAVPALSKMALSALVGTPSGFQFATVVHAEPVPAAPPSHVTSAASARQHDSMIAPSSGSVAVSKRGCWNFDFTFGPGVVGVVAIVFMGGG